MMMCQGVTALGNANFLFASISSRRKKSGDNDKAAERVVCSCGIYPETFSKSQILHLSSLQSSSLLPKPSHNLLVRSDVNSNLHRPPEPRVLGVRYGPGTANGCKLRSQVAAMGASNLLFSCLHSCHRSLETLTDLTLAMAGVYRIFTLH